VKKRPFLARYKNALALFLLSMVVTFFCCTDISPPLCETFYLFSPWCIEAYVGTVLLRAACGSTFLSFSTLIESVFPPSRAGLSSHKHAPPLPNQGGARRKAPFTTLSFCPLNGFRALFSAAMYASPRPSSPLLCADPWSFSLLRRKCSFSDFGLSSLFF